VQLYRESGKANYAITADKDLLVLEKHRKVIISPKDFAAINRP
jgi:predicted nucleic acid-binding protein